MPLPSSKHGTASRPASCEGVLLGRSFGTEVPGGDVPLVALVALRQVLKLSVCARREHANPESDTAAVQRASSVVQESVHFTVGITATAELRFDFVAH